MDAASSIQDELLDSRDKVTSLRSDVHHAVQIGTMTPEMAPLYSQNYFLPVRADGKPGASSTFMVRQLSAPASTQVVIEETDDALDIRLPRFVVSSRFVMLYVISVVYLLLLIALFWNMPPDMRPVEVITALTIAVIGLLLSFGFFACTRERIVFTRSSFSVSRTLDLPTSISLSPPSLSTSSSLSVRQLHHKSGRVADIIHVHIVLAGIQFSGGLTACQIVEGVRTHRFGRGLSAIEQQWLVQRIATFLHCPYSMAVALA